MHRIYHPPFNYTHYQIAGNYNSNTHITRYGPGVTYTVPRRATINAPPPMGPLGGLMGDPGASFSKYPRGGTIPKGGFDTQP